MNNNAKCFMLNKQNEYIEITYADLKSHREHDERFRLRRFIALHGMLLEVAEQDYQDFERQRRRERYQRKRAIAPSEDMAVLLRFALDATIESETQVLDRIMIDKLRTCLSALSSQDYELIEALYFCAKSGAEYGAEIGLTKQAVSQRKQRILAKLKKLMEI